MSSARGAESHAADRGQYSERGTAEHALAASPRAALHGAASVAASHGRRRGRRGPDADGGGGEGLGQRESQATKRTPILVPGARRSDTKADLLTAVPPFGVAESLHTAECMHIQPRVEGRGWCAQLVNVARFSITPSSHSLFVAI